MKKSFMSGAAIALSAAMLLSACGGGSINSDVPKETTAESKKSEESKAEETKAGETTSAGETSAASKDAQKSAAANAADKFAELYPPVIRNEGTPVEGGVLKIGLVSDSNLTGVFNPFLYTNATDYDVMNLSMTGAFPLTNDFKLLLESDEAPIKVHIDEANKLVEYTINPKFKWSDGSPVTTKDIVKTYEVTANNDFILASKSTRYTDDMKVIEGIEEYNAGTAETISGLEVIDDAKMKIHLKEMTPGVLWGGPFASEFVNAKQLEGIAMDKIMESDAFRKNPLSYGPYFITEIIAGEKVVLDANPHYIFGEPKVKKMEITVLPSSQQVAAARAGEYDILMNVTGDSFPEVSALKNVKIASRLELYMSYLSFKLGTWDSEKGEVVVNPNAKMSDVSLRKAMAHAVDPDMLGEQFYHGLRFRAVSPIASVFTTLHDKNINGTPYDLELAKKLLDDAGYKDTNNDGIRENKDGSELTINLAMMAGGEIAEPLSQYYMQQWKGIGLDIKLVDGRLLDLNNFYDRVQADDPAIDVYMAAFGQASDPNPSGLFSKGAAFNYSRYTTPELQAALDKLGSAESMDPKKMEENYHAFEAEFEKAGFFFPMMNRVQFIVINNRVSEYDFSYFSDKPITEQFNIGKIELLADKPIAE